MTNVLVTDGEQRAALAVVRSLGRGGYRVHVCSADSRAIAAVSRYTHRHATVADPLREPAAYVDDVERLAREWDVDVLLPITEPSHLALLPARDRFADIRLPVPDLDVFSQVHDKPSLLRTASRMGVAVPPQLRIEAESATVPDLQFPFPVVVKPARSVPGEGSKLGVELAFDRQDLSRRLAALPPGAYPVLLQQRILGPGVGVFGLRWEGRWIATFGHRRIREKPPWGGVSVYRESWAPDPPLLEASRRLLEAFDWTGVGMVEYKIDAETGTAYLMEVNGRFWGSTQLAVDAGVDFPRLLVEAALGRAPEEVRSFRTGIRSRWWLGDLDHLIACLRMRPGAGRGCPRRAAVVIDFLKLWRPGDRAEVFRLSDPRPSLREAVSWLGDAARSFRGQI